MRTDVIKEFTGEFFFLSNFYEQEFKWRGIHFPTAEHAFQGAKALGKGEHLTKILNAPTPAKAKYFGKAVPIDVEEWDNRRVDVMREIVHAKFQVDGLAGRLINTGAALLVEGNDWNDTFWGRCKGKGHNVLGSILMEERGYWLHGNMSK